MWLLLQSLSAITPNGVPSRLFHVAWCICVYFRNPETVVEAKAVLWLIFATKITALAKDEMSAEQLEARPDVGLCAVPVGIWAVYITKCQIKLSPFLDLRAVPGTRWSFGDEHCVADFTENTESWEALRCVKWDGTYVAPQHEAASSKIPKLCGLLLSSLAATKLPAWGQGIWKKDLVTQLPGASWCDTYERNVTSLSGLNTRICPSIKILRQILPLWSNFQTSFRQAWFLYCVFTLSPFLFSLKTVGLGFRKCRFLPRFHQ